MRRHFGWDKKYMHWGLTAFCVIAASVLFYMLLRYTAVIRDSFSGLMKILSPFVLGLVITYLLSPLMTVFEKLFTKKGGKPTKTAKTLSIILCEIILILILTMIVYMILPQLYSSIETIVVKSPEYFTKFSLWVESKLIGHPEIESYVSAALDTLSDTVGGLFTEKVLPSIGNIVSGLTTGVVAVVKAVFNLLVGIIVSVYLLSNRKLVIGGCRKLLFSLFTIETAEAIRDAVRFVDKTFIDFIVGKLLDSAIIGLICYIVCAILQMPYALLVSVIVGVTNIIPFFGPFIGAVPSSLIILMVNPLKCLIFVIFVIVLQQVDGNIIGPKILGNAIGVNGFWIMFAIIVGGGLFGFIGMLIGVPVFVVIYTALGKLINKKLEKNNLPLKTEAYVDLDYIDPVTRDIHTREKLK